MKLNCAHSPLDLRILSSTSVSFTLTTTVQVPSLELTHKKRITVCLPSFFTFLKKTAALKTVLHSFRERIEKPFLILHPYIALPIIHAPSSQTHWETPKIMYTRQIGDSSRYIWLVNSLEGQAQHLCEMKGDTRLAHCPIGVGHMYNVGCPRKMSFCARSQLMFLFTVSAKM